MPYHRDLARAGGFILRGWQGFVAEPSAGIYALRSQGASVQRPSGADHGALVGNVTIASR